MMAAGTAAGMTGGMAGRGAGRVEMATPWMCVRCTPVRRGGVLARRIPRRTAFPSRTCSQRAAAVARGPVVDHTLQLPVVRAPVLTPAPEVATPTAAATADAGRVKRSRGQSAAVCGNRLLAVASAKSSSKRKPVETITNMDPCWARCCEIPLRWFWAAAGGGGGEGEGGGGRGGDIGGGGGRGKRRGGGERERQSSDALVPPRLFQYPDRDVKGKAPLNVYWGVHGGKGGWHLYRALYLQFAGCSWKSNKRTNDIYTPDHGPHHCASISTSPHSCSASAPPASPM